MRPGEQGDDVAEARSGPCPHLHLHRLRLPPLPQRSHRPQHLRDDHHVHRGKAWRLHLVQLNESCKVFICLLSISVPFVRSMNSLPKILRPESLVLYSNQFNRAE